MRTSKPLVLAILWIVFSLTARDDDKASETFTVKGKTMEFRHVYAFWTPRLTDESKLDLYVLFSDEPIAAESLPANDDGIAKTAELVRHDKVHALKLHFDSASNKLFSGEEGAVYHIGIAIIDCSQPSEPYRLCLLKECREPKLGCAAVARQQTCCPSAARLIEDHT